MTTEPLFFGADPDMHHCACAVVRADLTLLAAWVHVGSRKATEHAAVIFMAREISSTTYAGFNVSAFCVEAQEIYRKGPHRTKNPRNILHLGHVAGALIEKCLATWPTALVIFPVPGKWKGQIDKLPHHRRILETADISADNIVENRKGGYCGIRNADQYLLVEVSEGQWMHLTDAIGLAQYAAKQHAYQMKKTELLTVARKKP